MSVWIQLVNKCNHNLITSGTLLPAAMMFAASQLNPDQKYAIIGLITIGYSLHEVSVMGGYYFAVMDIAPAFVGVIQGINKTVSFLKVAHLANFVGLRKLKFLHVFIGEPCPRFYHARYNLSFDA